MNVEVNSKLRYCVFCRCCCGPNAKVFPFNRKWTRLAHIHAAKPPRWEPTNSHFVCIKHFDCKSLNVSKDKIALDKFAVPTKDLDVNTINQDNEHDKREKSQVNQAQIEINNTRVDNKVDKIQDDVEFVHCGSSFAEVNKFVAKKTAAKTKKLIGSPVNPEILIKRRIKVAKMKRKIVESTSPCPPRICCICTRILKRGEPFVRFPIDKPVLHSKWKEFLINKPNRSFIESDLLCMDHFDQADIAVKDNVWKLKPGAIPCFYDKVEEITIEDVVIVEPKKTVKVIDSCSKCYVCMERYVIHHTDLSKLSRSSKRPLLEILGKLFILTVIFFYK